MARVHNACILRVGHDTSTEAVRGAGNVEEDFREHAHRGATCNFCEVFGKLVGFGNESGNALAAADEAPTEWPQPGAFPAHVEVAVERLHAQEDHALTRPSERLHNAKRF